MICQFGDKTIDLSKLVAIESPLFQCSGVASVQLFFSANVEPRLNIGKDVVAFFRSGEHGMPYYHNSNGDWTESDSSFYRAVVGEHEKLIAAWQEYKK